MKKISIYLDPELDAMLARMAARRGITKDELIRASLWAAANSDARPRISAIGVGHGPGDVSDDVDRHLEESGFGEA